MRDQRWRQIAETLAEALEVGDEGRKARALAIYRQASWRDDMDDLPTTDRPDGQSDPAR
jgi:hypothetical protein